MQQAHYVWVIFLKAGHQVIWKKKTGLNGYVYEFNADYSNNNTKDAIPYVKIWYSINTNI